MCHDSVSAAVVVMLRALKMYGMAPAVSDLGGELAVFASADVRWPVA